jgi:hypothetical protein
MSRGPQTFRERDLTRAARAVVKAGIPLERIEIEKSGKITLVTARSQDANKDAPEENEWDKVRQ